MKMIGLFSGIGMLEHAAHQLGYETAACVENDPFCQKVLGKRFPDAEIFGDIREVTGVMLKEVAGGHVSLIAGGFP